MPGVKHEDITKGVSQGCDTPGQPGYIPAGTPVGTPERWFDPCAFAIPRGGFLGTAGRNILRLPGFATVDLSLVKGAPLRFLGEAGRFEFRAEFFNILNRVNFGTPNRTVYSARVDRENPVATAGLISNTNGNSRQIQLALKIVF